MNDMIQYIVNRVNAGADRDQVCAEVQRDFSPQITFCDLNPEMIYEMIGLLWDTAYFMTNKQFNKE
ncbi:MAG TPA: hypothetical protein PL124_03930 [Candidatus Cloacimonadota bacterium]|nr:hypothetical protein [Candidatus Cloacimonadota bacterium]